MKTQVKTFGINTLIKTGALFALAAALPPLKAFVAIVALTLVYRYVIAAFFGLTVMPGPDMTTFYTIPESPCNIMSCSTLAGTDKDVAAFIMRKIVK